MPKTFLVYDTEAAAETDSILAGVSMGLTGRTIRYDNPSQRQDGKWVILKPPAEHMVGLVPDSQEDEGPSWWPDPPE